MEGLIVRPDKPLLDRPAFNNMFRDYTADFIRGYKLVSRFLSITYYVNKDIFCAKSPAAGPVHAFFSDISFDPLRLESPFEFIQDFPAPRSQSARADAYFYF